MKHSSTPELAPPLKWAGGKRWLVPHLRDRWAAHAHRRLVEPFVGGMAVALGLQPARALLNDTNPHLINFYRALQRGLLIELDMRNDATTFREARERFNHLIATDQAGGDEAAALFYYLNRTCYNGLCRFNNRGAFNVPFGRYTSIKYVRDFGSYVPMLAPWQFCSGPFDAITPTPEDLIYADPPYDVEFTAYSPGGFHWPDQIALAEWLAQHPGPVIASNQATPRMIDLYQNLGFDVQTLAAPRRIASNGDRQPALELLATRNM